MRGMGMPWLWKFVAAAFVFFLIDYVGLFVHFFELEYERYFDLAPPTALDNDDNGYANGTTRQHNQANNYYDIGYLQKAINKCTQGAAAPHLTILVKSALEHEARRNTIRKTWGYERRFSDVEYRCVFLIGAAYDDDNDNGSIMAAITAEAQKHGDIVQGDFRDAYFNNTIKTMLGIRWAHDYCIGSDFYMFADDDYYVSIKNVLKFIAYPDLYPNTITGLWSQRQHKIAEQAIGSSSSSSNDAERLFAGYVMQTPPLRHKFSKWYISLSEYPFDMWPPYVTAGAFILSNQALNELYAAGREMRAFRFDDIFLGMLALRTQLTLTHCDMFHFEPPYYNGAESYRHVLASHGFENSKHLEKVWTECRTAGYA